jgi:hypothetical protein
VSRRSKKGGKERRQKEGGLEERGRGEREAILN